VRRKDKVAKGVRVLQKRGHQVEQYIVDGKVWWQIDGRILATPEEIRQLADGAYSLRKLEKLHTEKTKLKKARLGIRGIY
jgi:hypothetical protein